MTGSLRPRVHFTARRGWINDPHGLVHVDGLYHVFFQHVPEGNAWAPAIHWGHATSTDLFSWAEQPVALHPLETETGCWSGSLVMAAERPVIFYTSVAGTAAADWHHGRVAVAHGSASLQDWHRATDPVVIPGPPEDVQAIAFRDPFVWEHSDGWTMLVGARLAGTGGAVLQYHSPDLQHWTYDGVAVQAPQPGAAGIDLGSMWECPQLVEVDGAWVLVISVWNDEQLLDVVYAVGDYDGRRFAPRSWGTLAHGRAHYATTAFLDAAGRRCVMSWVREDPALAASKDHAGALSIPLVLAVDGDRVTAEVHPGIERVRRPVDGLPQPSTHPGGIVATLPSPHAQLVVDWTAGPGAALDIGLRTEGDGRAVTVHVDETTVEATAGDGRLLVRAPVAGCESTRRVELVVDADILEMLVDGVTGVVATRTPLGGDAPLTLSIGANAAGSVEVVQAFELLPATRPPAPGAAPAVRVGGDALSP